MKTACIVMAHAGTEPMCRLHLPHWQASASLVAFFSPANAVLWMEDAIHLPTYGHRSHHDEMANKRFRHVLECAAKMDFDRFIIQEYDSVCFGAIPDTPQDAVAGNAYKVVPEPGFLGTAFIHPPLIIWKPLLLRLVEILEVENMNGESGFWDRLLGHVCEKNHIPIYNLRDHGVGYSQNTIRLEHLEEMSRAIRRGARLIHGIKTKEVLETITSVAQTNRRPRILAC